MRDKNRHPLQSMAITSGILSTLVGPILIGIFGGRWLDRITETEPLFLVLGLLLGLAGGVIAMLRMVNQYFSGD